MSLHPSNSDWLEKTLESTRRSVRQLEIDACRIRTDLARLEVANAAGGANGDTAAPVCEQEADTAQSPLLLSALATSSESQATGHSRSIGASATQIDWQPAAETVPEGMEILVGAPGQVEVDARVDILPADVAEPEVAGLNSLAGIIDRSRGMYRRATSPVMASLIVHSTILLLTVSITVATIERDDPQFAATILNLGDQPAKESENFDPHQLADLGDTGAKNAVSDSAQFDSIAALDHKLIPIDVKSVDGPISPGQIGLSDSIPSDLGTLMTGVGGLNAEGRGGPAGLGTGNQRGGAGGRAEGGRNSGRLESTFFFGTEARGNRFVFVVDNSSSMKGGRLEIATAELLKTIDGLSPRQSFYVIFVSDQTYPMFYPAREPDMIVASAANKKRLAEWLPKAILASGKNRELIKAMDMAAALRPQAVYLLWDGDMRYSEKVRLDVMTHLTAPNQWNLVLLG